MTIMRRPLTRKRPKKARNKYGNKTCRCNQDHLHDSIGEADYCNELEYLRRAGEIKSYKTQVTYQLEVNGHKICEHRPDFLVTELDGTQAVHEYKGLRTAVFNLKHKLFQACYPEIPYYIIPHKGRGVKSLAKRWD